MKTKHSQHTKDDSIAFARATMSVIISKQNPEFTHEYEKKEAQGYLNRKAERLNQKKCIDK